MSSIASKDPARVAVSLLDRLERIEDRLDYYRHLSNVRAFVASQGDCSITLSAAAQAIGISQSQLSRLFQEKIGISFRSRLVLRRIRVAMELMQERQISAYEAAHLSGFASYRSFTRTFKAVVGMTPLKYRKIVEKGLLADGHE